MVSKLISKTAGLPVEFPGYVEANNFFAGIDCLIVPPLWPEAFGRTVAEAILRGVPVIGANLAGVAEQIGPERQERLSHRAMPPNSPHAWRKRCAILPCSPKRLKRGNEFVRASRPK